MSSIWGDVAIAFLLAFITAFVVTPKTIKLAKKIGAVDSPQDERRVNKVEMPRLGGIAVILGFVISVAYLLITLTVEEKIDLYIDDYNTKLFGFFLRNGCNCIYMFY